MAKAKTKSAKAVDATIESKDELVTTLRGLIADAEELLDATSDSADSAIQELYARVQENVGQARESLADIEASVRANARRAAAVTDDYVHDNPWHSVGLAAAAGMLVGLLLARR